MTKEEEAVIEAARAFMSLHAGRGIQDPITDGLKHTLRHLDASRAPRPPMTQAGAEWELRAFGGKEPRPLAGESWMSECDFLLAARDLESAAWDRAIEAVKAKATEWGEGTCRGWYTWIGYVSPLKGKCHSEAAP